MIEGINLSGNKKQGRRRFFSLNVFSLKLVTPLVIAAMPCLVAPQSAFGLKPPWVCPIKYPLILDVDPHGIARSDLLAGIDVASVRLLSREDVGGSLDKHTVGIAAYDSSGAPRVFDGSRKGYERGYIEDSLNDTYPIVTVGKLEAKGAVFLDVVRRYADAMIEHGRDTYGRIKTGLFLSALDRRTMRSLTVRPTPPGGIRRGDRTGLPWRELVGANPQIDENLLRVLYTLSRITGEKRYEEAADHEIEWFFKNAQSPVTGLLPWGEHLSWHVFLDQPISSGTELTHEFARPWVLWDRSFELAPEASKRFALGLWNHQIADQETGGFDRHAPYDRHGPADGKDFARHAGFYIHTWAYAYKHTEDPTFLRAIETLIGRFERKRKGSDGKEVATIGPLDVETAASILTDPLAARLRAFAEKEDQLILQDLRGKYGRPEGTWTFQPTWQAGYAAGVTAGWAMFALARFEQTQKDDFRNVVVAVADSYLDSLPAEDVDVWPMTFAHIISAQVAAYNLTGKPVYLRQARSFAQMAVDIFWQDSPLPKASFKTDHYETITGGDSLALALIEVHAAINSLDTKIPPNTIDR